jgi:predicted Rossmann fold nucleotide-binding protein DprA/Smf involved in DNA uptake
VSDLVELARRYVTLSDQLEAVRGEIAKAVLNGGAGDKPDAPFAKPRSKPGSKHPNADAARKSEARILELLNTRPMRTAEIAVEMGAKQTTTTERLRRLKERGLITKDDAGWSASAP